MSQRHPTLQPVNSPGSYMQVSRAALSVPFLTFILRDPRLHEFLDKCGWQWLVDGEVDCPLGYGEALEFVLERLDHGRSRKQTAVVRKRGEPHQHSIVLERRNSIADRFSSLARDCGPNRCAHLVQHAAGGF